MHKKLFGALLLASTCGTAHANLISNGDFESGDFTAWNNTGNLATNSQAQLLAGVGATGNLPSGTFLVNFNGANLPATGVLSQEFATVLNGNYQLDFDFGRLGTGAGGPPSLDVEIRDVLSNSVLFNTTVTDATGTIHLPDLLDPFGFAFVATGTSTRLTFTDTSGGTFETDGVLDNVSVNAVPLPSAAWLMLSSCVLLARKRISKSV